MRTLEQYAAETATGCQGAGDYREYAQQMGFDYCEVWDWTSSAGDWTFFVSRDRQEWFPMFQENNFPRRGFTRTIDWDRPYWGTWEEVCEQVGAELY